jgi:hypothetical protein
MNWQDITHLPSALRQYDSPFLPGQSRIRQAILMQARRRCRSRE